MKTTKLEVYFLTYLKSLIRFGTQVSYLCSKKAVYQVIYYIYCDRGIVVNVQYSSWATIEGGVPKGSILNNLSDDLGSNPILFANNTSLFSVVINDQIIQ